MTAASPVAEAERLAALDVLRGVALFGVFLANFTGLIHYLVATGPQLDALPTAAADRVTGTLIAVFVRDKANTLFAVLFGIGFWLQMQRIEARGADFARLYRRRLAVLLALGILHVVFVWTWDILHTYALAGFLLLLLRRASDRLLLAGGLLLALFAREAVKIGTGYEASEAAQWFYSDEATLLRQGLLAAADYPALLRHFTWGLWHEYVLGGVLLAWILYALGRFMLGAWIARRGWLAQPALHLALFRRTCWIGLLAGTLLSAGAEGVARLAGQDTLAEFVHLVSTPLLAAGYAAANVLALQRERGRSLLRPFGAAGRMALTNYIMQSGVYGLAFIGAPFGLGLGGRIGMLQAVAIVAGAYALQMAFSMWWLGRYRYGPLEWCWRALTYGERPAMLRAARNAPR